MPPCNHIDIYFLISELNMTELYIYKRGVCLPSLKFCSEISTKSGNSRP